MIDYQWIAFTTTHSFMEVVTEELSQQRPEFLRNYKFA